MLHEESGVVGALCQLGLCSLQTHGELAALFCCRNCYGLGGREAHGELVPLEFCLCAGEHVLLFAALLLDHDALKRLQLGVPGLALVPLAPSRVLVQLAPAVRQDSKSDGVRAPGDQEAGATRRTSWQASPLQWP